MNLSLSTPMNPPPISNRCSHNIFLSCFIRSLSSDVTTGNAINVAYQSLNRDMLVASSGTWIGANRQLTGNGDIIIVSVSQLLQDNWKVNTAAGQTWKQINRSYNLQASFLTWLAVYNLEKKCTVKWKTGWKPGKRQNEGKINVCHSVKFFSIGGWRNINALVAVVSNFFSILIFNCVHFIQCNLFV